MNTKPTNSGTELNPTTTWYDLFFRNYHPALGRMHQVDADACGQHPDSYARQDPMAAKYASLTPYNYSFNDPVTFNDPSGADPPQTINQSATTGNSYASYTHDDRFDYFGTAVFNDAHGWRYSVSGALQIWQRMTGYSVNTMGPGWRPGQSGIAPGSGNHWADGIGLSDWSSYGGSQMFRDGLASGLVSMGNSLYAYQGGRLVRVSEAGGHLGYWEKYTWLDFSNEDASAGGKQLAAIGIGMRFKAFAKQQTQGNGPGYEFAGAFGFGTSVAELYRQGYGAVRFGTTLQNTEKLLKEGKFINYNGKVYSNKFFGNQYVNSKAVEASKNLFNKSAGFIKGAGTTLTVLSAGAAVYQFAASDQSGGDWARLGGAAIITGSAFIPVVGPFISIGLGIADSYGAFDGVYGYFDK